MRIAAREMRLKLPVTDLGQGPGGTSENYRAFQCRVAGQTSDSPEGTAEEAARTGWTPVRPSLRDLAERRGMGPGIEMPGMPEDVDRHF